MSVTVRIPTILRTYTGGTAEVPGRGRHPRRGDRRRWRSNHPGIAARVLDDQGKLRRFVNVYVNDDDVRFDDGLERRPRTVRASPSFRRWPAAAETWLLLAPRRAAKFYACPVCQYGSRGMRTPSGTVECLRRLLSLC